MKGNGLPVQPTITERVSRWCGAVTVAVLIAPTIGRMPARADQSGISQPALGLLNELVSAPRTEFFVYKNTDSGMNHSFPSGLFPGGPVLGKIHLDTACVYDPASPNGCTVNPNRLDLVRGTVLRVSFDPLSPLQFVGINFEEPEHYGVNPRGVGYDLRGATRVCFDALSPTPLNGRGHR